MRFDSIVQPWQIRPILFSPRNRSARTAKGSCRFRARGYMVHDVRFSPGFARHCRAADKMQQYPASLSCTQAPANTSRHAPAKVQPATCAPSTFSMANAAMAKAAMLRLAVDGLRPESGLHRHRAALQAMYFSRHFCFSSLPVSVELLGGRAAGQPPDDAVSRAACLCAPSAPRRAAAQPPHPLKPLSRTASCHLNLRMPTRSQQRATMQRRARSYAR